MGMPSPKDLFYFLRQIHSCLLFFFGCCREQYRILSTVRLDISSCIWVHNVLYGWSPSEKVGKWFAGS